MKTYRKIALTACAIAMLGLSLASAASADEPMTRLGDGTYVVDTTTLCAGVRGYRGATPVKVYIKKNKVVHVEFLPNRETPRYFNLLKATFIDSWNGQKVKDAASIEPDGYTGATFSANSVKENVRVALDYYQANKK